MQSEIPSGNCDAAPPIDPNHGGQSGPATSDVASSQPHGHHPQASAPRRKRNQLCRFFATRSGCRAGDACPYLHDASRLQAANPPQTEQSQSKSRKHQPESSDRGHARQYVAPPVDSSRIVQRPVPRGQVEDPWEFQISQIRRRYSPKDDGTVFAFRLIPSDPDFPYDIQALQCVLTVPRNYPKDEFPSLRVTNKELERGFQINVERGFDAIAASSPGATLLQMLNTLDKQLEGILSAQKADTIKLVKHTNKESKAPASASNVTVSEIKHTQKKDLTVHVTVNPSKSLPSYTTEQRALAEKKRILETRQLEARLGRLPNFFKSSSGMDYTIPVEPRKRQDLTIPLQAVKIIKITVPFDYNLEPCTIEVLGVSREAAEPVETAFKERAQQYSDMSLMAHINYLSQNMHVMSVRTAVPEQNIVTDMSQFTIEERKEPNLPTNNALEESENRSHVITIPRPPEWTVGKDDEENDSDEYSSYDSDEETGDDTEGEEETVESSEQQGAAALERGVAISFPHLELHGIELLELRSLSITIKCDRCKDIMDVSNIRNNIKGDHSGIREQTCKKCTNPLGIGYRMDMMHANSARAGYLDLDGCTVVDLLPSTFTPTCSECSTPYSDPGVVSVRGESAIAICRECHRKMTFRIPEVKFLRVNTATVRAINTVLRKKVKEKLGITAGEELPKRGRCRHYAKSYRWFRFSCCQKVFPCDRCHDEASDHPNEHANRMICGLCSREQNYRPEDCGICHSALTGKKSTGFWEGGKGTRDKARMSRKDPRKYKRRPGTKPKA
ncbi:hypothetical protein M501DRAFT_977802 [Patellaria atrata CBS 101060]|uniref:CHY-type domain-containing protein n=1 Tax=Patellaria atrata CBS 101060 TaxID=1346257 RepID=A0A9P4VNA8_9PEZI|nr:hypothetical protein M501DRAFT_977802 [Patellaria atrata CBS 101060]